MRPHGLYSPRNSPGQNTGVGSLSLLQGIFPTQGSNPSLPHCRQILYQLSHKGSPRILKWVAYPFSRGSSQPRNHTGVSCIAGGFFTNRTIREAPLYKIEMILCTAFLKECFCVSHKMLHLFSILLQITCTNTLPYSVSILKGNMFSIREKVIWKIARIQTRLCALMWVFVFVGFHIFVFCMSLYKTHAFFMYICVCAWVCVYVCVCLHL